MDNNPGFQIRLSGDVPWVVLGWRHCDDDEITPDLFGIYGPVPTREDAGALAKVLGASFPGAGDLTKYTIMPAHPVYTLTPKPESAVTA
jgi:hypothetical protein